MENNEYVSCKKCQCEITEKEAKRYNGYCRNCYKGKEYISMILKKEKYRNNRLCLWNINTNDYNYIYFCNLYVK